MENSSMNKIDKRPNSTKPTPIERREQRMETPVNYEKHGLVDERSALSKSPITLTRNNSSAVSVPPPPSSSNSSARMRRRMQLSTPDHNDESFKRILSIANNLRPVTANTPEVSLNDGFDIDAIARRNMERMRQLEREKDPPTGNALLEEFMKQGGAEERSIPTSPSTFQPVIRDDL
jgi:hypothetical protein